MRYTFFLLLAVFFIACETQPQTENQSETTPIFAIDASEDVLLDYEQLRLYPIRGTEDFTEAQERVGDWESLTQAMENTRFRITEKKPYGRFEDGGAVNQLTIQNKSKETVFIMSGDVVQGGNQDRMIAQDLVVPPNTITDVPVFCVERGRWQPREEEVEQDRRKIAFSGYYNVASNDLRRTMKSTNNQGEVWTKVGEITDSYEATSSTGTYAALEDSDVFRNTRLDYLRFFEDKFAASTDIVGIVAVSGNTILGADIFGHPALFVKKYPSLLHSYVTEAMGTTAGNTNLSEVQLERCEEQLNDSYAQKDKTRFDYKKQFVHLTNL